MSWILYVDKQTPEIPTTRRLEKICQDNNNTRNYTSETTLSHKNENGMLEAFRYLSNLFATLQQKKKQQMHDLRMFNWRYRTPDQSSARRRLLGDYTRLVAGRSPSPRLGP